MPLGRRQGRDKHLIDFSGVWVLFDPLPLCCAPTGSHPGPACSRKQCAWVSGWGEPASVAILEICGPVGDCLPDPELFLQVLFLLPGIIPGLGAST